RMVDLASMVTGQPNNLSPDGMHRTANGTSMASPSVAGVVALLFESCPDYDYAHIKAALTNGAKTDNNTGTTPNNYYGYGKVDALKSIMNTSTQVSLIDGAGTILADTLRVCVSEQLGLNQQFFTQRWSTGASSLNIAVSSSGFYYASGIDAAGCLQSSDTVEVILDPFIIPKPDLNIGDSSSCENNPVTLATTTSYIGYLWSNGANSTTISTNLTGGYRVLVTDADGCKAYSDSVNLTFFINPPIPEISVLNDTILTSSISSLYQWYFEDTVLVGEILQTIYAQDTGYYYVEAIHPNGCSSFSDSVFIVIPVVSGVSEMTNSQVIIYPNPFDETLYIRHGISADFTRVEVCNELGMILQSIPVSEFENPTITEISMSGFSSGIYFLYFRGAEKIWVQKVIKK
ncbi:MAG: S8 family peptidase, partial [Flavobacteriales bacterium]|nr:S8 family peptidase [Flavobacteriales bacterium]